jgi:hypothetical protein
MISIDLSDEEGMWLLFQAFAWGIPKSHQKRKKMAAFLKGQLKY